MQPVRDNYMLHLQLYGPCIITVSQYIWQLDVVAVAHFVMNCFDLLHAPDEDVSDDSSKQPSVAATDVTHSLSQMHRTSL